MGFNLYAKALPHECLVDGIDGLGDPWVAKVGVVPVNDMTLDV